MQRMTQAQETEIRDHLAEPENLLPSCEGCHLHVMLREIEALRDHLGRSRALYERAVDRAEEATRLAEMSGERLDEMRAQRDILELTLKLALEILEGDPAPSGAVGRACFEIRCTLSMLSEGC